MKKISVFILALSTTFFISCETDDKVVDQVLNDYTVGAVLRTRNQEGNPFNAFVPGSVWTVTVEEQDAEFGGLLQSIQLYASYTDNAGGNSVPEQLIETYLPSDLTTSSRGLPELTYTTTLEESATLLGVNYKGADVFSYRFEVTLTDGSTWSNLNGNGNVLGGSYFNSPYKYDITIACFPTGPVAGDYTLDMQDSFGDGWNGASVRVTVDGVATDYTIDDGLTNSVSFSIPDNTTTATFEYVSGDWDSEVTFQLFGPDGNLAYSDGPSPFIGDFTSELSLCPPSP